MGIEFTDLIGAFATSPLIAVIAILTFAVVHLYRKVTALEAEFRKFIQEESEKNQSQLIDCISRTEKSILELKEIGNRMLSR